MNEQKPHHQRLGIEQLRLTSFRCYDTLTLSLDTDLPPVVLTGHNGAGKTNILEAVSYLVPGRGLRSARLSDVAKRGPEDRLLPDNVGVLPVRWAVSARIGAMMGTVNVGTGRCDTSERRQIRIDGQPAKNQSELGQYLSAVWLTPAMDRLFCGDPAARRRFLDRLVQAFDPNHAAMTTDYNYALKQWGNLLREGRADTAWLTGLEETIASAGVAIAAARRDIVSRLSVFLGQKKDVPFPTASITLHGLLEDLLETMPALDVEEAFKEKLCQMRHLFADGGSVVGPHTSDFSVVHEEKGMDAGLCSTGEQKALLVSIILAQTKAQMQEKGQSPVLLLDEVSAHLDANRRDALFELLCELPSQVWMTGTDENVFLSLTHRAQFFNIENAMVSLSNVA